MRQRCGVSYVTGASTDTGLQFGRPAILAAGKGH